MAQFRVEFVLDQTTGKYLAEMYHPERNDELLVRTEALYPTQAAAVLGVVQLFKNAVLEFPPKGRAPKVRSDAKAQRARKSPAKRIPAGTRPARSSPARKAKTVKRKRRN